MKAILTVLFIFTGVIGASAQNIEVQKIQAVLIQQQESWNQGNLIGYMQGYHKSDSLLFVGKSGVHYGWQTTLDNYRKGYPDKASMGILDFDVIETKALSPEYYSMI